MNFIINIGSSEIFFINYDSFNSKKNWSVYSHSHSCFELHFILGGHSVLVSDDKEYYLKQNDICLIPPHLNHYTVNPISYKKISLLFKFVNAKRNNDTNSLNKFYDQLYQTVVIANNGIYEKYMQPIMLLLNEQTSFSFYKIKALLSLLVIELTELINREYTATNSGLNTLSEDSNEIEEIREMTELENYIDKNYMNNITLSNISDFLSLSEKQTARKILKLTGMGFRELIYRKRMEYAKELILYSDQPFYEIAIKTGYDSYAGFYRAFKNAFNIGPNTLRDISYTLTKD
ncbi:MAG: AraC family transcriptional regulator [Eubacteriales bacterium]|nr:AraC family transcriptional regulator [Eubacteriales bacterium]